MAKIAKLAIQSGLPQLDRLFDYKIPDSLLAQAQIGSRVKVVFGRSKKPLDGFIVNISDDSEFKGELSEVLSVVGEAPALQPDVFSLCSQLADRSASSLGELLKIAVPSHMPRAFASYISQPAVKSATVDAYVSNFDSHYIEKLRLGPARSFVLAEPRLLTSSYQAAETSRPAWVALFLSIAVANISNGKSSIILVPDYREHAIVLASINSLGLSDFLVDFSQDLPKSKQYSSFLQSLEPKPQIIVGSRSAAFAPAHNLGSILVFDESDRSFTDQSSPYLHTRDVVLVRQAIQGCSLLFSSHSMSADLKRLVDTGYVRDKTLAFAAPRVSISEPGFRVDSHAFRAIKEGLSAGAVLVQVSSLGDSTSLYCKQCDEYAACSSCNGPLWIDSGGSTKCRWCNGFALDNLCDCGSSEFVHGRAGSTRTAKELGKAFPSVRVMESTGAQRIVSLPSGRALVVATAGAEPYVSGGYHAVVLLDARVILARQNLRAYEEAVRIWSNAVAKAKATAPCVLVGVTGELAQLYSLWNHDKIAAKELSSRTELQLPPSIRMGSVTAELDMVTEISNALSVYPAVVRIGPAPVGAKEGGQLWRLIFKYPYAEGLSIAKQLKLEVARISAGKARVTNTGRSARAITVKMNDAEVV
jgi:primosomal protein N' (replication factor Y)